MYWYEGCRDPIQKITGDAYRKYFGIVNKVGIASSGKHYATHIDYEFVDIVLREELGTTSLLSLAKRLGMDFTTLRRRAWELGFDYDNKEKRWIRKEAA